MPTSLTVHYIDDLVQDCSNSIANALELLQSCTKHRYVWYDFQRSILHKNYVHSFHFVMFSCGLVLANLPFRVTPLAFWDICLTAPVSVKQPWLIWANALQWHHNGCNCVWNHQPHNCLLNRLFKRRSKKTSKLLVTGLCAGNSPVTGEFPAQMASYAENVSIWWCDHGFTYIHQELPYDQNIIVNILYVIYHTNLATFHAWCKHHPICPLYFLVGITEPFWYGLAYCHTNGIQHFKSSYILYIKPLCNSC